MSAALASRLGTAQTLAQPRSSRDTFALARLRNAHLSRCSPTRYSKLESAQHNCKNGAVKIEKCEFEQSRMQATRRPEIITEQARKLKQHLFSSSRRDRQHRGRSEPHISRERTPHRGTNRATGSTSRAAGNLEGHPLSAREHYQACHWDKRDTPAGLENEGALSSARKSGKIEHRRCSNSRL